MRTPRWRSRLRVLALLVVFAGTSTIAAHAASGFQPGSPSPIPESAWRPVTVPSPAPGALAAPSPGATGPELAPVFDPFVATPPPERARPSLEAPDAIVVVRPTPTPTPRPATGSSGGSGGSGTSTSHAISGAASWYCRAGVSICTVDHPDTGGFDAYAAAGPRLRDAIGDWRGRIVYVDGIRVKLIDWCQCYRGEPNEKLLDLYYDVYARVGGSVTVRW